MARTVAIGVQDFEKIIINNRFYIDKTGLIREWWDSGDEVTLITRPRRFGKTLNMTMLERFFATNMRGRGKFLNIWIFGMMRDIGNCRVLIQSFFCPLQESRSEIRRMP